MIYTGNKQIKEYSILKIIVYTCSDQKLREMGQNKDRTVTFGTHIGCYST